MRQHPNTIALFNNVRQHLVSLPCVFWLNPPQVVMWGARVFTLDVVGGLPGRDEKNQWCYTEVWGFSATVSPLEKPFSERPFNVGKNAGDVNVVDNLRRSYPKLGMHSDEEIALAYENYSLSEDAGHEERFPEWLPSST